MDGLVLKEIPLSKDRLTIGRKPHNDIQIDNLAISGEHALVVTILNDSFLEDLNSTNGTLVNGQPIKKHFLRNNDVIELGKYKLKYLVEAQVSNVPVELDGNVGARSSHDPLRFQDLALEEPARRSVVSSAAMATPADAAVIQILTGPNAGKELELNKPLTTLGKPGVQVAVIARRPNGYFITHVEGSAFPTVNGQSLDAQAHPLTDCDVIEIAGVKMGFFLKA
jgi:pSer/pThr/pTyr-binding forkhead associated (FHA) protein